MDARGRVPQAVEAQSPLTQRPQQRNHAQAQPIAPGARSMASHANHRQVKPQPDESEADTRARARLIHKASASLQHRTSLVLASVAKCQAPQTEKYTDAMLALAVMDLSAGGYDLESVADRLSLPVERVRRLHTQGLADLAAQTSRSAEIVRAQTDAKLARLEAKLAAITDCEQTDTTSLIRAIEVQARLIGQRVELYGAKVRETDADLSAAVQDVIREAHQLDRDRIGHDAPATVQMQADNALTLDATLESDVPK